MPPPGLNESRTERVPHLSGHELDIRKRAESTVILLIQRHLVYDQGRGELCVLTGTSNAETEDMSREVERDTLKCAPCV